MTLTATLNSMERLIRLEERHGEWWYSIGWRFEGRERFESPQFGGMTRDAAIASAKIRFGSDYEVEA